jgi:hypothetical protein
MTDPFQNILQAGNRPVNHFPVTSRYYRIETVTMKLNEDKQVAFLRRRFIPPAESLTVISIHQVKEGDRLDNVTANYIGDPEQFWQVADANNAIKPEELTDEPGNELRISQSQNIPGF